MRGLFVIAQMVKNHLQPIRFRTISSRRLFNCCISEGYRLKGIFKMSIGNTICCCFLSSANMPAVIMMPKNAIKWPISALVISWRNFWRSPQSGRLIMCSEGLNTPQNVLRIIFRITSMPKYWLSFSLFIKLKFETWLYQGIFLIALLINSPIVHEQKMLLIHNMI